MTTPKGPVQRLRCRPVHLAGAAPDRHQRSPQLAGPADRAAPRVTITGTNFTGATKVALRHRARPPALTCLLDPDHRSLTGPARRIGHNIFVTTPGRPVRRSSGRPVHLRGAIPTVTSISPTRARPLGAPRVTITGTNFTGATKVALRHGAGHQLQRGLVDPDHRSLTGPAAVAPQHLRDDSLGD